MEKSEELNFGKKSLSFGKSILVVDDQPDLLELQKNILEMNGFKVITALSAAEAFKILSETEAPKLILLDVRMEDMSGPEFLIMLEEVKPEIVKEVPIVFLTGLQEVPLGKAAGVIEKPFDIDYYLESINRFMGLGL